MSQDCSVKVELLLTPPPHVILGLAILFCMQHYSDFSNDFQIRKGQVESDQLATLGKTELCFHGLGLIVGGGGRII